MDVAHCNLKISDFFSVSVVGFFCNSANKFSTIIIFGQMALAYYRNFSDNILDSFLIILSTYSYGFILFRIWLCLGPGVRWILC